MDHRSLQNRVVPDPNVAPERAVLAEPRPRSDDAVVADDRRTVDDHARVDIRALAQPHPRAELESVDVHLHPLVEDVLMGLEIGLEGADVLPVAVGHVPEERLAGGECLRERVPGEVHRSAFGDEIEDLRLEYVDPGVDGVAEYLSPRRLLEESLDRTVLAGDHDAELEGIVHRFERQGGQAAPRCRGRPPPGPDRCR